MNNSGFTLVETIMILAIIAILSTMGTIQFSQYVRKNSVERQTRELYVDLIEMRSRAMFEKKSRLLKLTAASYSIYSSRVLTGAPVETKQLKVPITFNNTGEISYDTKGMLDLGIGSVCVTESNSSPVDSIVLSMTRIQLGKRDEGEACAESKIVAK